MPMRGDRFGISTLAALIGFASVAVNAFHWSPQSSSLSSPSSFSSNHRHPRTRLYTATQEENQRPHLVFPGGALYFYWQAGVVTYLRENGYDLTNVTMAGASAGSLTATLTAANVDFYEATELALKLAKQAGVWDRGSLQGVWAGTIDEWLETLLPQDAVSSADQHELTIIATRIPSFQKERFQKFSSRRDLIECNMASIHIPWFVDGCLTTKVARSKDQLYIDGSFLLERELLLPHDRPEPPTLVFDHKQDLLLKDSTLADAVKLVAPKGIWGLAEQGKSYAKHMDEQSNLFKILSRT